jgi:hypothetical protein
MTGAHSNCFYHHFSDHPVKWKYLHLRGALPLANLFKRETVDIPRSGYLEQYHFENAKSMLSNQCTKHQNSSERYHWKM